MPINRPARAVEAPSAYVRYWLGMGVAPTGRLPGWAIANMTGAPTLEAQIARHGDVLRDECARAGFVPACDVPIERQPPAARGRARKWAAQLLSVNTKG